MHVVPPDLIRGDARHEVVDVARARDEDREGARPVVTKGTPATAGLRGPPLPNVVARRFEQLVGLAEDDRVHVEHLVGQTRGGIRECRKVRHVGERADMEARSGEGMRLLER